MSFWVLQKIPKYLEILIEYLKKKQPWTYGTLKISLHIFESILNKQAKKQLVAVLVLTLKIISLSFPYTFKNKVRKSKYF